MLAAAAFASAAALLAASIPSADAHGYMLIPESQFKGSANSAWVVQIDPVWKSDKWDGNKPGSVDAFKALKSANNFKDLKTLMDDTSVYGADCGFTDPNGTPQPIPTDGKATFSRALVHVGPCEIWLDDKKGVDGNTVWQSYKDCIPLQGSGGGGGGSSTSQTQSSSTGDSNSPSSGDSNSPSSGDSSTPSSGESATPAPESNDSPTTQGSSAETPEVTPAPSSKCNGRKRRN
ncbi:hypothetical protein PR003_g8771 [Phytophthora rubi]|uniref:Uncharacterized protein n=1 Tax=Phytophthora rubi TaxID=129364 RepID=A0A6A3NYG7_9STRA|nr:hypothetical protein PR002_g1572 [Phytophthora rubi]KAE9051426.1 hypothetical protein PR001_g1463 [Phytophthora rubi]KAE9343822.1 hypothetical protein PR003_g8771 [Phytophthora rubi]